MDPADRRSRDLSRRERLCLVLWALLLGLAIAFQLGSRALFEPDEGRNAEVMREMSVSGDYFVPRLNDLLFLDKPFLYYAAGGLAMKALGATELAARLPAVLCTLALAFGVGALARRWWGDRAGALAGLAAAATPLPLVYTQIVIFDAMLTLWICAAVGAFYLAVERDAENGDGSAFRYWSVVAWAAMGLGVLTKGPVALLVPLAAVLPWALWRRRAGRLVERGAPLVLAVLIGPWLWVVSRADPDFLHYALVTETWSRLTSNELKRDAPSWYYLPVALLGALPWSVVPLAGARRVAAAFRARESRIRFLASWFVVPFVLFSILHSKRIHYILPLVPALVLLSIWLWVETPNGARLPGVRFAAMLWAVLGGTVLALGLGAAPKLLSRVEGADGATVAGVAAALGTIWLLAGVAAFLASRSPLAALITLALPPLALLLATAPLVEAVGERRSARSLAQSIDGTFGEGIEIVAVETFPASLPFYLERPLVLVTADGLWLRSNYILRRYSQMVGEAGPMRSPAWLEGAVGDCGTPRAFLVRQKNEALRRELVAAGRPQRDGGRDVDLFGPCASGEALSSGAPPSPPSPPPPAPPAGEAGRVSG
ncbi:MAG: glycosyltransferase family 39 protein [Thermoanaerobaculia bacterium]|nr:glycosyltransferase family 39 protein [Thermoanaerobaculia bacterium]